MRHVLVEIIESSLCTTEDTNTIINMNDLMPSQMFFQTIFTKQSLVMKLLKNMLKRFQV